MGKKAKKTGVKAAAQAEEDAAVSSPKEGAGPDQEPPTDAAEGEGVSKEQRRRTSEKIDHLLESRPDAEDLEQRNVLTAHGGVAPQLQGVQKQLQRKMSADELSHRLEARPDVQELRDLSIVRGGDGVAPSLQATQEKLQRQLNSDKVNQHLTNRPSVEELRSHGVLDKTDTEVAPSLTATAKKLERNLVQNQVSHLLESRPEKDELVSHNILEEGEVEEEGLPTKRSLSQRARYALALKAASRIAADNLISADEKARLKDLILSDNEKIVAALESYELDEDIEEMLDTLYRVAKVST
ncbi:hypothetical protein BBJ28_00020999 [Nothophytophthora sp. Chile5]|nr:hypothetical protein BBJ28_00020999 [Nothophytophthora sp. Chile5]